LPLLWLAFAGKSTTKRKKRVTQKSVKGKGTFVNFSMNIQANLFKIIAGGGEHHL
jgi:hypothetical protein